MKFPPKAFKAPFIDPSECWRKADEFRQKYSDSGVIPVDVLAIAEFDLDLDIRTITRLREDADVDALILGDWKTLIVDEQQYLDDRFLNRMRFSIAHELGHYVLHKEVFETIPRDTTEEWIKFIQEMPENEYGFLEFHANEFAGRFLVPVVELEVEFQNAISKVEKTDMLRKLLKGDAVLAYLCIPIAKSFAVSPEVIERRLVREKLWPLRKSH